LQQWADGTYTNNPDYVAIYNQEMQNEAYVHRDPSYADPTPLWVAATRNAPASVSGTPWSSSAGTTGSHSSYDEYAIVDPRVYGYAVENAQHQYGNGWQPYWANLPETNYLAIRLIVPRGSSGYIDLEAYTYTDSSAQTRLPHGLWIGWRQLAETTPSNAVKYKYTASDNRYGRVVVKITGPAACHIRVRHVGVQTLGELALPAPLGLSGAPASAGGLALSWSPVAGAEAYNIYRDGQLIGTSATASFTDAEALPGTAYSYAVSAWRRTHGEGQIGRRHYLGAW
jgi:hypothetical protein